MKQGCWLPCQRATSTTTILQKIALVDPRRADLDYDSSKLETLTTTAGF